MKVRLIVVTSLALVGCGGKKGTIELDLVEPFQSTPLSLGNKIEIIAGPDTGSSPISMNKDGTYSYSISFDEKPPNSAYNLVVEVLSAVDSSIVAYGETPLITLNAVNQGPFGVWLAQPGTIGRSPSTLTTGATSMAGCGVSGLGAVVSGGEAPDASGMAAAVTTSYVYDSFTSAIIDTAAMTTARLGAVAIPASAKGVVFGGSSTVTPLASLATAEAFDPTSGGSGQWVTLSGAGNAIPTAFPSIALFSDGSGLVTGGYDANSMPTNAATLITTSTISFGAASANMNSQRVHHVSAPLLFGSAQASGAIIVGGLSATPATGSTIVETYSSGGFQSIPDGPLPNLWNATATSFNGGASVLVAGGGMGESGVATSSAYVVTTTAAGALAVTNLTGSLGLTARKNHTATLIGADILLCGGIDATGAAQATCDLVTTVPTLSVVKQLNGLVPRQNHVAIALETGPIVFIGGDDNHGGLVKEVDIYTPTMAEEAIVNKFNNAVIGTATADGGT